MGKLDSSLEKTSMTDYPLGSLLHLEKDPKTIRRLSSIFSILSKDDALTIFLHAKDGLESELDTPQKIKLTKKQYYTRLKQLVDLGLLIKNENIYTHTAFGSIVYDNHLVGLLSNMKISRELEMIDMLKKTSKFQPEEIASFVSKLNPELKSTSVPNLDNSDFAITSTFDNMVRKVLDLIEFAEKEILLVSRFQNDLIINSILKKSQTGIKTKVISDIDLVGQYFELEKSKAANNDRHERERATVVANPFYPSKVERRYAKTPFCFLLVDQKKVGLEIIENHNTQKFKMAIFASNKELVSQMMAMFDDLWKIANENPPQIKQNK